MDLEVEEDKITGALNINFFRKEKHKDYWRLFKALNNISNRWKVLSQTKTFLKNKFIECTMGQIYTVYLV